MGRQLVSGVTGLRVISNFSRPDRKAYRSDGGGGRGPATTTPTDDHFAGREIGLMRQKTCQVTAGGSPRRETNPDHVPLISLRIQEMTEKMRAPSPSPRDAGRTTELAARAIAGQFTESAEPSVLRARPKGRGARAPVCSRGGAS